MGHTVEDEGSGIVRLQGAPRRVFGKVDGTLTVAIEPVFILSDSELTDEVLHP